MTQISLEANIPEDEHDEFYKNLSCGKLKAEYTSTGKFSKYKIHIEHIGLKECKTFSDKDEDILSTKIQNQLEKWHNKWINELDKRKKAEKLKNNEDFAIRKTEEAKKIHQDIGNILHHTLNINDAVDWDLLKNNKPFKKFYKNLPEYINTNNSGKPINFKSKPYPKEPNKIHYTPVIKFTDVLLGRKKKLITHSENSYYNDLNKYKKEIENIKKENQKRETELYEFQSKWSAEEKAFEIKKEKQNNKIDEFKNNFINKDPEAILEYFDIVLNNSQYPDFITKNFELEYNGDSNLLIIDYYLPSPDKIPPLKEAKYIKSRNEIKETYYSDKQLSKIYDDTLYKMTLRTLHEIFEADTIDCISSIAFNGIVEAIDKSTGKETSNCVLSIYVSKYDFEKINLANVDPKRCFNSLKGVGSSQLSGLVPVKPIVQMNKHDDRIIDHYNVADGLDKSSNLAAMDWQDFEHLIREVFEYEFKTSGGEVNVTQASRDRGVDAIAFDPDPIRGGKIVIQAKRYTNIVGVEAVRDLYGTVLNEGATKGILVTTSNFGNEAYNFAKDKPISLVNGSNLLYLFEKHGKNLRIDIQEAKMLSGS